MILKQLHVHPSGPQVQRHSTTHYKRVQEYQKNLLYTSSRSCSFVCLFFFQTKLFPLIYLYWQKYQSQMLEKLKSLRTGITIAGDGRHDSMGHSAKFGAYTIFCCTVPMIIHFSLVQVRKLLFF